ncbi:hypothetical protein V2J09_023016 [Rumex salicifolius]
MLFVLISPSLPNHHLSIPPNLHAQRFLILQNQSLSLNRNRKQAHRDSPLFFLTTINKFMTVEARHINLFSSFLPLSNSNQMMLNPTSMEANTYTDSLAMAGGATTGFSPSTNSVFPSCNSQIGDAVMQRLAKTMNSSIVNLSFSNDGPLTRKRQRSGDSGRCGTLSAQLMQQHFELDRLIFLHMEKVKREVEEQSRMQSHRRIRAIEEAIAKKLREKDEQIVKMSKLSVVLQERAKSLFLENQLWRDLAQSNEATANALRSNLEQLLVQVKNKTGDVAADAESCCGSSGRGAEDEVDGAEITRWRKVARTGGEEQIGWKRMCRRCGGMESCVLVLPCRHLCLCTACGPTVDVCPICKSTKNASVRVNFS